MSLLLPPIFSTLQVPLLYTTNILGLAIGPQHRILQLGLTFPPLVLLVAQSFYRKVDTTYGLRYSVGVLVVSLTFMYLDWVVLKSPDKEKWRKVKYVKGEDGKVREELEGGEMRGFGERFWWAARIAMGPRYVGWSQQVRNVPARVEADYPRWRFIMHKLGRLAFMHVLNDAICCYTVSTPHGSFPHIEHLKPTVGYADQPFLRRFWFSWVHIIVTYTGLEVFSAVTSIVSVALGLSHPRDCPRAFGDLRGMYSVRNSWAVVWHQQCRRICSAPGTWLVRDVLGLRKGTFASKYIQLYVGFLVSAIAHGGAAVLMSGEWVDDGSLAYFLGQATIIMVEDHVIDLGKRMGFKDSVAWRLVGSVWTVVAFGVSLMPYVGGQVDNAMWVHQATPDWFGLAPKFVL